MSDIVISVENLWKQYRYGVLSHATLRKDIQSWWARVRGKEDPNLRLDQVQQLSVKSYQLKGGFTDNKSQITDNSLPDNSLTNNGEQITDNLSLESDRFWALRDINFEVKQGEVLGIIGKNGAGKSTLLKIMSKVTAPTRGQIKLKGRVASLLEVGTGFHPELTGGENIFLNGAILGMTKDDIRKKFDEIVAFAGVEKFIATPVKRYSSGMYIRLAFAVAAHLEPEILIVDEVLAMGDVEFQQKCLGKMGSAAGEGRTVLFVSHDLNAVKQLCAGGMLLKEGMLEKKDTVENVIETYAPHGQAVVPVCGLNM